MTNHTTNSQKNKAAEFGLQFFQPHFEEHKNPNSLEEAIDVFRSGIQPGQMAMLLDKVLGVAISSDRWHDLIDSNVETMDVYEHFQFLKMLLFHLAYFGGGEKGSIIKDENFLK